MGIANYPIDPSQDNHTDDPLSKYMPKPFKD